MDIYTVSFFGHREVERAVEIESKLDQLLHDLITQKQYFDFLVGRDGEFDLLVASSIRRAVKQYGCSNTSERFWRGLAPRCRQQAESHCRI